MGKDPKDNLRPPKKGEPSRNPKGRPKGKVPSEYLREYLGRVPNDGDCRSLVERGMENLALAFGRGELPAIRETLDRLEGKPRQAITVTSLSPTELEKMDDEQLAQYIARIRSELA